MIYVSSACIKENKIKDTIIKYVQNGIRNIELSGGTNNYSTLYDDLAELKNKYDIKYAIHGYFPPPKEDFVINLASCNNEIYEKSVNHYMKCIDMMKSIECNVLSIHAGFLVEIQTEEIGRTFSKLTLYNKNCAIDRFCKAYERIQRQCKKNGINLYLENNVLSSYNYEVFGRKNLLMMTNYMSFDELRKRLEFELLLDLGHLHVSCKTLGLDFEKECQLFSPYVKWIHISSNNGVVDEHQPLCESDLIVNTYKNVFSDNINITLETNGNINDILNSIDIVQREQ